MLFACVTIIFDNLAELEKKNISAKASHAAVQAFIMSRLDYCNILFSRNSKLSSGFKKDMIGDADKRVHITLIIRD